ncbi:uncharacterized protein BROUX77_000142 [Berkeleyomyces rouxiae]|uniref:uncharacterized protein n=1 Tax=Berkeleyomyces rouxiae TaxID=2035830 RepID=UPI003B7D6B9A
MPSPGGVRPAKEGPDDPIEAKGEKDEEIARHLEDLLMAWPDTVRAYSDGAKVKDGGAGARWTLVVDNTTCAGGSKPLGTWQEVADAEAIAALHAVQAAHELPQETTGDLCLCLDNRGIVNRLNAEEGDLGTSQTATDETRRLLASWKLRQGGLFAPKARVRWVPGQKDIPGNERADRLAGGVAGTEVGGLEMSLSFDSQTAMAAALTKMNKASAVFSGCTVDTATKWHTYVINRVPKNTRNLVGQVSLVTIPRIEEDIESQVGVCATRVAWSKHNQDSSPTSSIVFPLEKPLRTSLKLFGSSAPAIKARQHGRVQQCDACFSFHRTGGCP